MGRHFISVLGTGMYSETNYCYEGKNVKTPFVQEALLDMLFEEAKPGDKVSIFLTDQAKEKNWESREYTEKERENAEKNGRVLPEISVGLKEILTPKYGKILAEEEKCMLPLGGTEEELWKIFHVILDSIEENEEVYIDITHSLRNIPIQMLAVIFYARTLKSIQVQGIYYGAFEVKTEEGTPIFNLRTFLDVLDWSQAAKSFIKYGDSDQIYELCQEQQKVYREKMRDLLYTVKELNLFTHDLETSRGYYDVQLERKCKASALGTYKRYKKAYTKLLDIDAEKQEGETKQASIIAPMEGLLNCIDRSIENFDVDTNLDLGMEAVRWAIEKKKTQQGFTALEETIKTFLCCHYGLNEAAEEDRDWISKNICRYLNLNYVKTKKERKVSEDECRRILFEQWMHDAENGRFNEIESKREKVYNMFLTIPEELFKLIPSIGDKRNSMNHFGYSNSYKFSSKNLEVDLSELYQKFVEIKQRMEEGGN